jgi:hypothetical protein
MQVLLDIVLVVLPATALFLGCARFVRLRRRHRLHGDRLEFNRLRRLRC